MAASAGAKAVVCLSLLQLAGGSWTTFRSDGTEGVDDCKNVPYPSQQFFELDLHTFPTLGSESLRACSTAEVVQAEFDRIFGHTVLLDASMQQQSLSNPGSSIRLDRSLQKLREGNPIGMGIIGGSVTAGSGTKVRHLEGFFGRIASWINATYPHPDHRFVNGGMSGSTAGYMAQCLEHYLPSLTHMDIIFVEFDLQDPYRRSGSLDNHMRRGYERMLRALLSQPQGPAVVEIHYWAPRTPNLPSNSSKAFTFYHNPQAELDTLAAYYRIPALSLRNAIFHKAFQELPGFRVADFMCDVIHPNHLGHRYIADMVISLLQTRLAQLLLTGPNKDIDDREPMLPPLFPNNEAQLTQCFAGNDFRQYVHQHEGWNWVDEGHHGVEKLGYVTTEPGHTLEIVIDTLGGSADSKVIGIGTLRSWEHMGMADVSCVSGCACSRSTIHGNHSSHTSVEIWHHIAVTQSAQCAIHIRSLDETASGEHKVKITSVMITDMPGSIADVQRWNIIADWFGEESENINGHSLQQQEVTDDHDTGQGQQVRRHEAGILHPAEGQQEQSQLN